MQKRFLCGSCALLLGLLAAGIPLKAQSESMGTSPVGRSEGAMGGHGETR